MILSSHYDAIYKFRVKLESNVLKYFQIKDVLLFQSKHIDLRSKIIPVNLHSHIIHNTYNLIKIRQDFKSINVVNQRHCYVTSCFNRYKITQTNVLLFFFYCTVFLRFTWSMFYITTDFFFSHFCRGCTRYQVML